MTKPTLLVLAAGMGSRYGGLKQIDPVGPAGETIIDYSIYDAMRAGFGKLVFVIRHDIEQQFREIVGSRFEKRIHQINLKNKPRPARLVLCRMPAANPHFPR